MCRMMPRENNNTERVYISYALLRATLFSGKHKQDFFFGWKVFAFEDLIHKSARRSEHYYLICKHSITIEIFQ